MLQQHAGPAMPQDGSSVTPGTDISRHSREHRSRFAVTSTQANRHHTALPAVKITIK